MQILALHTFVQLHKDCPHQPAFVKNFKAFVGITSLIELLIAHQNGVCSGLYGITYWRLILLNQVFVHIHIWWNLSRFAFRFEIFRERIISLVMYEKSLQSGGVKNYKTVFSWFECFLNYYSRVLKGNIFYRFTIFLPIREFYVWNFIEETWTEEFGKNFPILKAYNYSHQDFTTNLSYNKLFILKSSLVTNPIWGHDRRKCRLGNGSYSDFSILPTIF